MMLPSMQSDVNASEIIEGSIAMLQKDAKNYQPSAERPPSMEMIDPWIHFASSLARNTVR